jgi:predicted RNA-binding protein
MCESNAYLVSPDGDEQLLMESVGYLRSEGGRVLLRSIFGEEKEVPGSLKEMNLTGHKILLEAGPG